MMHVASVRVRRKTVSLFRITFSPDGTRLAVGSAIGIWIYDVRPGEEKELDLFTGDTEVVNALALSPDGTMLASGGSDKTVRLWDVNTGQQIGTFIGHTWTITSIAFSPDGNTLASSSNDQTVQLWDTP